MANNNNKQTHTRPVHLVRDIPERLLQDLGLTPEDVGQKSESAGPTSPFLILLLLATVVAVSYLAVSLLAYASYAMSYIPGQ